MPWQERGVRWKFDELETLGGHLDELATVGGNFDELATAAQNLECPGLCKYAQSDSHCNHSRALSTALALLPFASEGEACSI